ncbi:MAG: glycerate kinase [Leptospiraceae bacterium]|nr:glycerate kinase [Leptospiraceae bacterium]
MRILVAPDKFKGSLTATEVAAALVAGIKEGCSADHSENQYSIVTQPIGDGGEGTMALIAESRGLNRENVTVTGPMGRPVAAEYFWGQDEAYLEMASASGLGLVSPEERNPEYATTFGTGELILRASESVTKRINVGLGGSATIDGGMGCLAALGYRFLDRLGRPLKLPRPENMVPIASILSSVAEVQPPAATQYRATLRIVADVTSPLNGPTGAIARFARQKGLSESKLDEYANAMESFSMVCERSLELRVASTPGAGAAGGLGFGLLLAGASLEPGFRFFAQAVQLENWMDVDLAITGEGKLDAGSLEGKGPGSLAQMLKQKGIPCIAFCGKLEEADRIEASNLFEAIYEIGQGRTSLDSVQNAAQYLKEAARDSITDWLGRRRGGGS